MAEYRISQVAKKDLIWIHPYGTYQFGDEQADKYFNAFFKKFELIAEKPYSFESADFIKIGYRKYVCGVDAIFYRIKNNVTEIMTIIGRQDRIESLNKFGWIENIGNKS
jgi:toxin ParE1/3/4